MFVLPVKFMKRGAVSAAPDFRKAEADLVCLTVKEEGDQQHVCTVEYELAVCHLKEQVHQQGFILGKENKYYF